MPFMPPHSEIWLRRCTPVFASLLLIACAEQSPSRTSAPVVSTQEALHSHAYQCEGDLDVVVEQHGQDAVYLYLPASSIELERVPSVKGARYAGADGVEFRHRNDGASTLTTGDGHERLCHEDRHQSLIEDARLRGVLYWAAGFEPGWRLEIGPDRTVLVTDYGATRAVFATSRPDADPSVGNAYYHMETATHTLDVTIVEEPCRDASGRYTYPGSLEIEFDGNTLTGCGMALH